MGCKKRRTHYMAGGAIELPPSAPRQQKMPQQPTVPQAPRGITSAQATDAYMKGDVGSEAYRIGRANKMFAESSAQDKARMERRRAGQVPSMSGAGSPGTMPVGPRGPDPLAWRGAAPDAIPGRTAGTPQPAATPPLPGGALRAPNAPDQWATAPDQNPATGYASVLGGEAPQQTFMGLANGGPVFDATQGGMVPPGPPGQDTVPAVSSGGPVMLDSQPGAGKQEYVLPADTTAAVGIDTLDKLKAATHTPKMADGGVPFDERKETWAQGITKDLSPTQTKLMDRMLGSGEGSPQIQNPEFISDISSRVFGGIGDTPKPSERNEQRETVAKQSGIEDTYGVDVQVPQVGKGVTQDLAPLTDKEAADLLKLENIPKGVEKVREGVYGPASRQLSVGAPPQARQVPIYSDTAKGATQAGLDAAINKNMKGVGPGNQDYYGGYDVSNMTPQEFSMFRQQMDRQIGDSRAAIKWLSLPTDSPVGPNEWSGDRRGRPTAAVARSLRGGPKPTDLMLGAANAKAAAERGQQQAGAFGLAQESIPAQAGITQEMIKGKSAENVARIESGAMTPEESMQMEGLQTKMKAIWDEAGDDEAKRQKAMTLITPLMEQIMAMQSLTAQRAQQAEGA